MYKTNIEIPNISQKLQSYRLSTYLSISHPTAIQAIHQKVQVSDAQGQQFCHDDLMRMVNFLLQGVVYICAGKCELIMHNYATMENGNLEKLWNTSWSHLIELVQKRKTCSK